MVEEWKDKLFKNTGLKFEFTDASHPKSHGCGKMIYKDGGCNHIWSCPCDFHWCWQVRARACVCGWLMCKRTVCTMTTHHIMLLAHWVRGCAVAVAAAAPTTISCC
jgi:hypothetical protein